MSKLFATGSRLTDMSLLGGLGQRISFRDPSTLQRNSGGGGGAPVNNDPIGYAADQWNSYHMGAIADGNRPTWQSNVHAGLGAARLDGSSDFLRSLVTNNLTANRSAITFYAVVKWAAAPTARQPVFISAAEDAIGSNLLRFEHGSSAATAGRVRISARRVASTGTSQLEGSIPITTNITLLSAVLDWQNTTARFWRDGVLDAENTSFLTTGNSENVNSPTYIGSNGVFFFNGWIFETSLFHDAHNDAQRAAVLGLIRNTYEY